MKKAQLVTPFRVVALVLTFLVIWVMGGYDIINLAVNNSLETGYFSGIEAFLLSNLTLFIVIFLLLFILAGMYWMTMT